MGQLTFEQNLLLSTLIYFEDIVNNPNGDSLEKIVKGIQGKGGLDQYKVNNQLPAMMNEDEWNDCFNKIYALNSNNRSRSLYQMANLIGY